MGECPPWYPLLSAARYLGVAPWVLAEQPITWLDRAKAAMSAEAHARQMKQKHQAGQFV